MKRILYAFFLFAFFFLLASPADAKLLPRYQGGSTTKPSSGLSTRSFYGVIVTPRFTADRGGLVVYFGNLQNAKSVTYMFSYETNGKPEGISGSVNPNEGSSYRNFFFGTCSTSVCTKHLNIANAKLEVTSQLTNGKTSVKRFRIKV